MNAGRNLLGFVLAPLATPLTFLITTLLRGNSFQVSSNEFAGELVSLLLIGYLAAALGGLPLALILHRLNLVNALSCAMAGLIAWFVLAWILSYPAWIGSDKRFEYALSFSIAGAMTGLAFYLIAHWSPRSKSNRA